MLYSRLPFFITCGLNNNRKAVVVCLSSAFRASKKEKILKFSNGDSHMGIPTGKI